MTDLDALLRFWRAQDAAFERVDPTWWGAVVSDVRFPHVQEANYARVETRQPVTLDDLEEPLLASMRRSAAARTHVVLFHAEDQTDLLAQASSRGERLNWDAVMEHVGELPPAPAVPVDEVPFDGRVASAHRASLRWFDINEPDVVDELSTLERTVSVPAGRRWFIVRDGDDPVSFAGLWVLDGVAYLDHVVTFPEARGRGYATALTATALRAARDAGAEATYLLAEPDGAASRMYERLGFRELTRIASWISPA